MPCLPQPPATCRPALRRQSKPAADVQTAPLVTSAVPAAAASSLLDLVSSTLPVPPPLSSKDSVPWRTLLLFQSATTQRLSKMSVEKDELVQKAKLAEQAER